MKILIFSDIHWSANSSIIREFGKNYTIRLEHLIDSMNWVNTLAIEKNCEAMICAGDFCDKAQLIDIEITALKEINWNNLPCYFLCGNHESSVADLRFSSLKALESKNHFIVTAPTVWKYNNENEIRFLPYVVEANRKPIDEYFKASTGKTILISHNDIQGINYGGFESKIGFTIPELEGSADIVLNGHLHNSEWVSKKILNVGSFSAHNFTNDSLKYNYGVWILDTDTLKIEFIENPHGFNFYKLDILTKKDLDIFKTLKQNSVISIKCTSELLKSVQENLASIKAVETRISVVRDSLTTTTAEQEDFTVDYLPKFCSFIKEALGEDAVVTAELAEICK